MKAFIISFAILIFAVSLRAENSYLVGGTNSSFAVNQLGAATFTLPIEVEPGINGMQPDLAVVYNSMGGNGIMGLGFSLQGLSAITKVATNHYTNIFLFGKSNENYALDGKRLMAEDSEKGIYCFENEKQTVIKKHKYYGFVSFEVTLPNGNIAYYTQELSENNNSEWWLSSVVDNHGNELCYKYEKEDNYLYLSKIEYLNSQKAVYETVDFGYEERRDYVNRMAYKGVKQHVKKRLSTIKTSRREYCFNYGSVEDVQSPNVGSSLMSRVESIGLKVDGISVKPISFTWTHDKSMRLVDSNSQLKSYYPKDGRGMIAGDYNNDGIDDFVYVSEYKYESNNNSIKTNYTFTFANPTGFNGKEEFVFSALVDYRKPRGYYFHDLDGDGCKEMVLGYKEGDKKAKWTIYGIGHTRDDEKGGIKDWQFEGVSEVPKVAFADFDIDGKEEGFVIVGSRQYLLRWGRTPYEKTPINYKKAFSGNPIDTYVADFDMDGLLDVMVIYNDGYEIFNNFSNAGLGTHVSHKWNGFKANDVLLKPGDFDGDGCVDFLVGIKDKNTYNTMQLFLYKGNGNWEFKSEPKCFCVDMPKDIRNVVFQVFDSNKDGKMDAVLSYNDTYGAVKTYWLVSNGNEMMEAAKSLGTRPGDPSRIMVVDVNGDGCEDLLYSDIQRETQLVMYGGVYDLNPDANKITGINGDFGKCIRIAYKYTEINTVPRANDPIKSLKDVRVIYNKLNVVSCVTETVNDLIYTTEYGYGRLLAHVAGKGLLGFDTFSEKNNTLGTLTFKSVERWNDRCYIPEVTVATKRNTLSNSFSQTIDTITYNLPIIDLFHTYLVLQHVSTNIDIYGNKTTVTQTMDSRTGLLTGKETKGFDGSYTKEEYEYTAEKAGGIQRPQKVITRSKHFQDDNEFVTEVRYEYNEKGDVSKSTDAGRNVSTEFEYDACGNVVAETTVANDDQSIAPVGYRYEYDRSKRFVTCKTDINSGDATRYTYNNKNHLAAIADPLKTTFEYDALGRQIKSVAPDGVATSARYEWTDFSRGEYKVTATQTGTPDVVTYYDAFGRAIKKETKGELGIDISTVNTYDEKGQLIQTVETEGDFEVTNSYDYDELGRIAGEYNDKTGKSVKYEYGKNTTAIIEDGKKTVKEFDSWGNVRSLTDPKGNTAQYTYASCGKPKSISFEDAVYRIDYDMLGRKTAYTTPNSYTRYYFYDAFDRLVSENYTNRKYDDYKYDELGRLIRKKGLTEECTYTYGDNQLTRYLPITEKGKNCEVNYEYDGFNRLVRRTKKMRQNKTFVRSYTYTPAGKLSTETLPSGDVMAYEYDNNGFATNITLNGETVWSLSGYNGIDREVFISNPGGYALKRVTHRDSKSGAIKAIEMLRGSTKLHSFAYEFDQKTGNLMKRTGMQYRPEEFEYDKLDRLTRVSGGSELTMEYEDNGNIAYKSDAGEYTYKTKRPHAVTKVAAENMWNWIWPDIEYTGYNKPCRIHVDDLYAEDAGYLGDEAKMEFETIYSAEFDGNNDKCHSSLNLIDFFTDEGYGFEEHFYDGNYEEITEIRYDIKTYQTLSSKIRKLIYCYTPDGLTAIKVNSTQSGESALYRVETDHLGSLYALRGTDGTARYVCKYDAWGSRTLSTVPSFMRMGYCGHEHWDEFNLIDMGGRMYDPKIARFVSIDPHVQAPENIQNFNGYSYCLNNPLKYSDPSGEFWQIVVGALIGGITNVLQNVDEISNFGEGAAYFGVGAAAGAAGALSVNMDKDGFAKGFVKGAAVGGAMGIADGIFDSAVNGLDGKATAKSIMSKMFVGSLSSGLSWGVTSGLNASINGRHFWYGDKLINDSGEMMLPQMNQTGEMDCRIETFRSIDMYMNGSTEETSALRAAYPNIHENTDRGKDQYSGMYESKGLTLRKVKNLLYKSDDGKKWSRMTDAEIANGVIGHMLRKRAVVCESKITDLSGQAIGHATAIKRARVYDSGRVRINMMDPSGALGRTISSFRKTFNMYIVF